MALPFSKKRKLEDGIRGRIARKTHRVRKQSTYSSGSSQASDDGDAASANPSLEPVRSFPKPTEGSTLPGPPGVSRKGRAEDLEEDDRKDVDFEKADGGEEGEEEEEGEEKQADEGEDDEEDEDRDADQDEDDEGDEDQDQDSSESSSHAAQTADSHDQPRSKRHDPTSFANSLSAILASKLSTRKRDDPLLSRSRAAQTASQALADSKLELQARRALRAERKVVADRGRVRDVLVGDRSGASADMAVEGREDGGEGRGATAAQAREQERRLRKTAQRGVVKLFNAVRAAQVKAEMAAREGPTDGVVGMARREERIGEMGRNAFLELVGAGGMDEV